MHLLDRLHPRLALGTDRSQAAGVAQLALGHRRHLDVLRIRGEEGTTVRLGIRRDDAQELLQFTIERAKIEVPNIESEMLEADIGYIKLEGFNQNASAEIRAAIEELSAQGAKGYILDLRNNPGGLLSASVEVSSLFISDGVVVTVEDRTGEAERHRAAGKTATDAPLVVLVNFHSPFKPTKDSKLGVSVMSP